MGDGRQEVEEAQVASRRTTGGKQESQWLEAGEVGLGGR